MPVSAKASGHSASHSLKLAKLGSSRVLAFYLLATCFASRSRNCINDIGFMSRCPKLKSRIKVEKQSFELLLRLAVRLEQARLDCLLDVID